MAPELILPLLALLAALAAALGAWLPRRRTEEALRSELERLRRDVQADAAAQMGPLQRGLSDLRAEQAAGRQEQVLRQSEQLDKAFGELRLSLEQAALAARTEQREQLQGVQRLVNDRLDAIQRGNEEKLEAMRRTVDEKLHDTLEKRLGESFKLVSERLEQVQRGLGEMQNLAQDVGGLKRALTNVKTRGVLGEAQLGSILEQFLAPGQYERNVRIRPRSNEMVEFAVRFPGPEEGAPMWLPVDAKFPTEDYQRLMEGYDAADASGVEAAGKALEARILTQAREIRDKYIAPPYSTDFALLFLPFEGLYAEALRRPGLLEKVQRECRVTFVGPTTLMAVLNSLQVGFRTLAISRQTAEVWKLLSQVKTEFARFGDSLSAAQKKIEEAGGKLGDVARRKELMERRLSSVETLPEAAPIPELAGGLPGPGSEFS
ncbi:MAG: DNA recombination protein RmuC [Acidobacteria bacterium]|nr:DNA recombination protein RmuC [Acidobacteriota bacterium]